MARLVFHSNNQNGSKMGLNWKKWTKVGLKWDQKGTKRSNKGPKRDQIGQKVSQGFVTQIPYSPELAPFLILTPTPI